VSLRAEVGQLLAVGFPGPDLPAELALRIARSEVGAVMLFRPNIASPIQVAELVKAVRAAAPAGAPCLVATDQEGGLVQRLRAPLTVWPDMFSVAAAGDAARTEQVGRALGDELAALGIGWNFAPVLDVHTNPSNPVIANRSFGTTPQAVITHALAFWRGLGAAGVLGCGKHFPGHGDTTGDSHLELPVVVHPRDRLDRIELAPFAAAARAGLEAIMTAHVVFSAVDATLPATLSPAVLTGVLRGELGYGGVIVSDDLGMKAVADRYPIAELAVRAVAAGCDVLLVREPHERQVAAFEALLEEAEKSAVFRGRVGESAARVDRLKAAGRVGSPVPAAALGSRLGTPAHQALAASFARVDAAPTLASASPVVDA
jgi:beta-N-acetylhexosaminidase